MTPTEAQKRYFSTIEVAIAKAEATGERAIVEAKDGAETYAYPPQRGGGNRPEYSPRCSPAG